MARVIVNRPSLLGNCFPYFKGLVDEISRRKRGHSFVIGKADLLIGPTNFLIGKADLLIGRHADTTPFSDRKHTGGAGRVPPPWFQSQKAAAPCTFLGETWGAPMWRAISK